MNKANGENCQISFLPQLDRWVIASKNVSLLAKEEKDLKIYEGTQRFHFATLIAHSWFEILNSHKIDIEILKKNLQNKTLIGEYCGNPNHQHLVNYEKTDLLFFAIVDHDSNDSCLPPHQAFNFFKIHNLSHVSMKDWGIFSNMESLKSKLIQIFKSISKGLLKEDGEGSVVYFAKVDEKKVPIQVLSLCKIKTLEYSILRKLREKLKTLVNLNFKKSKENPKAFISQLFKKETENLCKNVCPLIDIEINKYSIIAEKCFNYIMDNKIERKSIQDNYLKILTKVKESLESKINKKSEEYMNSEEITKSEEEKKSEEKKYYDPDLNFEILFHQEN